MEPGKLAKDEYSQQKGIQLAEATMRKGHEIGKK